MQYLLRYESHKIGIKSGQNFDYVIGAKTGANSNKKRSDIMQLLAPFFRFWPWFIWSKVSISYVYFPKGAKDVKKCLKSGKERSCHFLDDYKTPHSTIIASDEIDGKCYVLHLTISHFDQQMIPHSLFYHTSHIPHIPLISLISLCQSASYTKMQFMYISNK